MKKDSWQVLARLSAALLVASVLLPVWAAAAAVLPDIDLQTWRYPKGCKESSPEQKAAFRKVAIRWQRNTISTLGLQRINRQRQQQGRPLLSSQKVSAAAVLGHGGSLEGAPLAPTGYIQDDLVPGDIPQSIDNSQLPAFPPIGLQEEGSCVAWATTYYMLTYITASARGWDAKNGGEAYRFSPRWTYNLINGGQDQGLYTADAMLLLQYHGAARWSEFYANVNPPTTAWCSDPEVWRRAIAYRTQSVNVLNGVDTAAGLASLKTLLLNGYVVNFTTHVTGWYPITITDDTSTTADDSFVGQFACHYVSAWGNIGHEMTIVGFNDNLWLDINQNGRVDPGEKGVFKVANQWGNTWANGGYIWLAYDALRSVSAVPGAPTYRQNAIVDNEVTWATVRPAYGPKLLAEVRLQAAHRGDVMLQSLRANQASQPPFAAPEASLEYRIFEYSNGVWPSAGGPLGFDGLDHSNSPQSAPAFTFVFDLTDIAAPDQSPRQYAMKIFDLNALDWPPVAPVTAVSYRILDGTSGAVLNTSNLMPQTSTDANHTIYPYAMVPAAAPTPVPIPAQLTGPLPNTVLPGSAVTFTWTPGTGVNKYWFDLGTSAGTAGLSTGEQTTTSRTVSNIPTDGRTIYAQLFSYINGAYTSPFQYQFTAATTVPATNYSLWDNSVRPTTECWPDPSSLEVGVTFRTSLAGQITALRFYKGAQNTGVHIGHLWSRNGTLLAQGTFANETASGWQQLNLASPVSILPNTTYIASYHTDTGNFSLDYPYFVSGGRTNGPLSALQSGVDGGNGVYAYGSGAPFPNPSGGYGANYWVDVVFATGSTPGPVPAVLTSPTPSSILPGSTVTFTWSAGTGVSKYWFDLGTSLGTAGLSTGEQTTTSRTVSNIPTDGRTIYAGLYSYINNAWVGPTQYQYTAATIGPVAAVLVLPTPGSVLSGSTVTFTWSIGSGVSKYWFDLGTSPGTASLSTGEQTTTSRTVGNIPTDGRMIYAGLYSFINGAWVGPTGYQFTAANQAPVVSYSLWDSSARPSVESRADFASLEVGVTFRTSVAGKITAIRFYKGAQNTGVHTGHVWSRNGTLLAQGTFTNESISGWQQLTLGSPVSLAPNTTYIASYHMDSGNYSFDYPYFSSSGRTNGPLSALMSGVDGGNGVYAYGSGALFPDPSLSGYGANYWVDVVFSTGGGVGTASNNAQQAKTVGPRRPPAPVVVAGAAMPANGTMTVAYPDARFLMKTYLITASRGREASAAQAGTTAEISPFPATMVKAAGKINLSELKLAPGAYHLAIRAMDPQGQASEAAELDITILAAANGKPRAFPNPWRADSATKQQIIFDGLAPASSLKIFSVTGRMLITLTATEGGQAIWDLSADGGQAASGFYLYLATDPQGNPSRGKLAIVR